MLQLHRTNIVLTFLKMDPDLGEHKEVRVTLSNVRQNLTSEEIVQIAEAFNSLIVHSLAEIGIVQYSEVVA